MTPFFQQFGKKDVQLYEYYWKHIMGENKKIS